MGFQVVYLDFWGTRLLGNLGRGRAMTESEWVRTDQAGIYIRETSDKPKPKHRLGILEVEESEDREAVKAALSDLLDALKLSDGVGGIRLPGMAGPEKRKAWFALYRYVGEALLGQDCPEKEVLT